ncbi:MAG: 1-acyl-sn-glycerol-3-phosphate acyltransferase [Acidobacteria bacterium]|nr:1-acyl-sn-glycerol-3-phosphate acyltransferase [Acidobacteriota bacterium]
MSTFRSIIGTLAFFGLTFGIYAVWFVGSLVIPNKQYWRQVIFKYWARGFARLSGMKIEVIGTPPKPPFFLVCNHLSYVDIPTLRCVVEGVFVAKREIRDWPVAGRIISDFGQIFIDRTNRRDIPRAGDEIVRKLDEGEGVIIFPEGTSTKGEDVLPFNSSFLEFAAKTGLSVSYASLTYETPAGDLRASDSVCWWDETGFFDHLYRFFGLSGFTAVIRFGDAPITNPNRKELAHELREKVRESFIPVI